MKQFKIDFDYKPIAMVNSIEAARAVLSLHDYRLPIRKNMRRVVKGNFWDPRRRDLQGLTWWTYVTVAAINL